MNDATRVPNVAAMTMLGVRLDDVASREHLRARCASYLDGRATARIFTPNPEILLHARADRAYAELLNRADLSLPDGTGVALIGSLRRRRRLHRWPGVEVGALLLELAAERGATVAFVGGSRTSAATAAAMWRRRFPRLRIEPVGAGVTFGPDGTAHTDEAERETLERLHAVAPALILVALGAPKQERWIAKHSAAVPSARVMMGVGGALDMWAGRLRRAPVGVRKLGLEWAWRLALEPRRWRRVARATIVFPARALTESRSGPAGGVVGPARR